MTDGASSPQDPEVLGVPLSVYAAVLGYICEGVPLETSLDHVAIPVDEWPAVDAAWSARLAESAVDGGALIEACDQHRFASEAHVERPLPPLDEDLRAWLDFFRAFSVAADPLEFLASRRLVEVDLFRLLAHWQARGASEKELQEASARILGEPPGPVPRVEPRSPTLKAETRRPRRAAIAPVKGPTAKPSLAETSMVLNLSKIVLPFARSSAVAPVAASIAKAPVVRARRDFGETKLAVSGPIKPAIPFAEEGRKGAGGDQSIVPPVPPVPAVWPEAAPPAAPRRPLAETSFAVGALAAPALPFAATPPGGPPSAPQPSLNMPVVVRPNPLLGGTRMAVAEPARPALPFGPEGAPPGQTPPPSSPPVAPAPAVNRAPQALAGTMPVLGPVAPALPFSPSVGGAAPPPKAPGPRLPLSAYAAMHAEITFNPAAAMATIARYGLTPATKSLEDAAWTAKFAAEPALRMAWMQEMMAAGNRLRGK
jgi:hypothetical protein